MIVIGDKGRAQLTRTHAKSIDEIIQDVGKVRITFSQARPPVLTRSSGSSSYST